MVEPCQVNLLEEKEIIQYFRDFLNVGYMLVCDVEEVIATFRKKLIERGWSKDNITKFQRSACYGTILEGIIPHTIQNRGSYAEYLKIKGLKK